MTLRRALPVASVSLLAFALAPLACSSSDDAGAGPGPAAPVEGGAPESAAPDASAPSNPLDALDPEKGSFADARSAALALARRGVASGADRPSRLFEASDPLHVVQAIETLAQIAAQDVDGCANAAGGCRTPDAARTHLQTFAAVKAPAKEVLTRAFAAFDRWGAVAGAAEALAFAHLLEQSGKLGPADVARIQAAADAMKAKASAPLESVDVSGVMSPNDKSYFDLFSKKAPLDVPTADLAAAARAVIDAVLATFGANPSFADMTAPFYGPDLPAPRVGTPAHQATRALGVLIGLRQPLDAGAAIDAYLARLETLAGKTLQNTLSDADWDPYLADANAAFGMIDARVAALADVELVSTAKTDRLKPVAAGAPDDPNADDYKPNVGGSLGEHFTFDWSFRATTIPRATAPALPRSASARPLPADAADTPARLALVSGASLPPLTIRFAWSTAVPVDHIELRVHEVPEGAALPTTKPTHRFAYRARPDGTLPTTTRLDVKPPATDGAYLTLQVAVAGVFADGRADLSCKEVRLVRVGSTLAEVKVPDLPVSSFTPSPSGDAHCGASYPLPAWDGFDDTIPADHVVITRSADAPFRPWFREIAPGTTKIFVENTSATDTWQLRSLYTPGLLDSGYAPIGAGGAIDTGPIPPGTTKEVSVPAGGAVVQWMLADPAHSKIPYTVVVQ